MLKINPLIDDARKTLMFIEVSVRLSPFRVFRFVSPALRQRLASIYTAPPEADYPTKQLPNSSTSSATDWPLPDRVTTATPRRNE